MKTALCIATGCCSAALFCALAAASPTRPPGAADRRGHTVIDNCATAAQLRFKTGVDGVVLDERDGAEVAEAIVRRFPMLDRDGLYPQAVALWRPPKGNWVYATLSQKAQAPNSACFTSNVDASLIDATPVLILKYFSAAP